MADNLNALLLLDRDGQGHQAPVATNLLTAIMPTNLGQESQADRVVFLGENSATADREALARAQQMATQGVDPDAIRRQTGWFYHNNSWSYEVPDTNFRQTQQLPPPTSGHQVPFFNHFDHPEVLAAYPHLRDSLMVTGPGHSEDYFPLSPQQHANYIADIDPDVGGRLMRLRERSYRPTQGNAGNISTPLHELQHVIDNEEGVMQGRPIANAPPVPYARDPYEQRAFETEFRRTMSPAERRQTPFQLVRPTLPPLRGR